MWALGNTDIIPNTVPTSSHRMPKPKTCLHSESVTSVTL
jgi:hypothetical protein